MTIKPFLAALLLSVLPALQAQQFRAMGPLDLCEGQQVSLDAYNASSTTASIEVELVDAVTALTVDRAVFSFAGQRGGSLAFSSRRILTAPNELSDVDCRSTNSVVALVEADRGVLVHPGMRSGTSSTVNADQKTIIGGFKSMSGMSSETEVVEYVSRPFLLGTDDSIAVFSRTKSATPIDFQIVGTRDGKNIGGWTTGGPATQAKQGWSYVQTFTADVQSPRDPSSGGPTTPAPEPVVLRFQVRGAATIAVSVQQSAGNQVAIEELAITHEGLDLD